MYKECRCYFCTIWFICYILKRNYFNSFYRNMKSFRIIEVLWKISTVYHILYYLQIILFTDFLIFIYVYFLMKIKIPWPSLNDSVFIIWVLSNRILGISWSSCCVNVDFPHIKEKLAAIHLFTHNNWSKEVS